MYSPFLSSCMTEPGHISHSPLPIHISLLPRVSGRLCEVSVGLRSFFLSSTPDNMVCLPSYGGPRQEACELVDPVVNDIPTAGSTSTTLRWFNCDIFMWIYESLAFYLAHAITAVFGSAELRPVYALPGAPPYASCLPARKCADGCVMGHLV